MALNLMSKEGKDGKRYLDLPHEPAKRGTLHRSLQTNEYRPALLTQENSIRLRREPRGQNLALLFLGPHQ